MRFFCYRFVAQECSIALDDYRTTSTDHLRAIISGERKTIKSKDLRSIHVPQFPGLNVEAMLEFAENHPEVFEILPSDRTEIENLHRQYVANVIYTVAPKEFSQWLDAKIKKRNKKLAQEQNLNIKMDPEIYEIYQRSTSISGKYDELILIHILI